MLIVSLNIAPQVPLSSSESGFPACPTSHRCSGSIGSQQPRHGNPAHWKNKALTVVCFGCEKLDSVRQKNPQTTQ